VLFSYIPKLYWAEVDAGDEIFNSKRTETKCDELIFEHIEEYSVKDTARKAFVAQNSRRVR
jgi:hypothetical protein